MNFTFIEYFLVILSSSFIIFSLAIRSESTRKYYEFLESLRSLKDYVDDLFKRERIKVSDDKVKRLHDKLDSRGKLFKWCLTKVNSYVYHSFYFVFFLSSFGLGITLIYDLDLFKITSTFPNIHNPLLFLIHIVGFILIYWYSRAIFVLILYTKIDYEYLEKLAQKVEEIVGYKALLDLDDEKNDGWSQFKIFCLKFILFPFFLIFNKEFKQFFYKYYNL